jgi:hypothetical protein
MKTRLLLTQLTVLGLAPLQHTASAPNPETAAWSVPKALRFDPEHFLVRAENDNASQVARKFLCDFFEIVHETL